MASEDLKARHLKTFCEDVLSEDLPAEPWILRLAFVSSRHFLIKKIKTKTE